MSSKDIALWLICIVIVGLGVYLVFFIHSQSFACMGAPIPYGIRLLEEANNAPVSCICSKTDKALGTLSALFTTNGSTPIQPSLPPQDAVKIDKINYSSFFEPRK